MHFTRYTSNPNKIRPWVGGISGNSQGAYSVALSGGYDDDVDLGYALWVPPIVETQFNINHNSQHLHWIRWVLSKTGWTSIDSKFTSMLQVVEISKGQKMRRKMSVFTVCTIGMSSDVPHSFELLLRALIKLSKTTLSFFIQAFCFCHWPDFWTVNSSTKCYRLVLNTETHPSMPQISFIFSDLLKPRNPSEWFGASSWNLPTLQVKGEWLVLSSRREIHFQYHPSDTAMTASTGLKR